VRARARVRERDRVRARVRVRVVLVAVEAAEARHARASFGVRRQVRPQPDLPRPAARGDVGNGALLYGHHARDLALHLGRGAHLAREIAREIGGDRDLARRQALA